MGGGDKSLLDLGGKTMLDVILARLAPQITDTILNANGDPDRFARFRLPVVADPVGDYAGPLAGILAGLTYAERQRPEVSHVVSVAGDTPFFPTDLVAKFCAAVPSDKPVIALASSSHKLHPVFGIWPVALRPDLHDWLDSCQSGKVMASFDRQDRVDGAFDTDSVSVLDSFFNAN